MGEFSQAYHYTYEFHTYIRGPLGTLRDHCTSGGASNSSKVFEFLQQNSKHKPLRATLAEVCGLEDVVARASASLAEQTEFLRDVAVGLSKFRSDLDAQVTWTSNPNEPHPLPKDHGRTADQQRATLSPTSPVQNVNTTAGEPVGHCDGDDDNSHKRPCAAQSSSGDAGLSLITAAEEVHETVNIVNATNAECNDASVGPSKASTEARPENDNDGDQLPVALVHLPVSTEATDLSQQTAIPRTITPPTEETVGRGEKATQEDTADVISNEEPGSPASSLAQKGISPTSVPEFGAEQDSTSAFRHAKRGDAVPRGMESLLRSNAHLVVEAASSKLAKLVAERPETANDEISRQASPPEEEDMIMTNNTLDSTSQHVAKDESAQVVSSARIGLSRVETVWFPLIGPVSRDLLLDGDLVDTALSSAPSTLVAPVVEHEAVDTTIYDATPEPEHLLPGSQGLENANVSTNTPLLASLSTRNLQSHTASAIPCAGQATLEVDAQEPSDDMSTLSSNESDLSDPFDDDQDSDDEYRDSRNDGKGSRVRSTRSTAQEAASLIRTIEANWNMAIVDIFADPVWREQRIPGRNTLTLIRRLSKVCGFDEAMALLKDDVGRGRKEGNKVWLCVTRSAIRRVLAQKTQSIQPTHVAPSTARLPRSRPLNNAAPPDALPHVGTTACPKFTFGVEKPIARSYDRAPPSAYHVRFTEEEVERLIRLRDREPRMPWSEIKKHFTNPNRGLPSLQSKYWSLKGGSRQESGTSRGAGPASTSMPKTAPQAPPASSALLAAAHSQRPSAPTPLIRPASTISAASNLGRGPWAAHESATSRGAGPANSQPPLSTSMPDPVPQAPPASSAVLAAAPSQLPSASTPLIRPAPTIRAPSNLNRSPLTAQESTTSRSARPPNSQLRPSTSMPQPAPQAPPARSAVLSAATSHPPSAPNTVMRPPIVTPQHVSPRESRPLSARPADHNSTPSRIDAPRTLRADFTEPARRPEPEPTRHVDRNIGVGTERAPQSYHAPPNPAIQVPSLRSTAFAPTSHLASAQNAHAYNNNNNTFIRPPISEPQTQPQQDDDDDCFIVPGPPYSSSNKRPREPERRGEVKDASLFLADEPDEEEDEGMADWRRADDEKFPALKRVRMLGRGGCGSGTWTGVGAAAGGLGAGVDGRAGGGVRSM